jgi:hypothetical protein
VVADVEAGAAGVFDELVDEAEVASAFVAAVVGDGGGGPFFLPRN